MFNCVSSFWNGNNSNWKGYKATTVTVATSLANTLTNNYWIMTSIPLPDEDDSNVAGKIFYMGALLITNAVLWGAVGLGVDYLRSTYENEPNETQPMLNH